MIIASECRHCRANLPAYLHRELSPRAARRVGAHLARCAACESVYQHERAVTHRLTSEIAAVGRAELPKEQVWRGIQAQLAYPRRRHMRFHKRYGAAALLVIAALILPAILSGTPRALASVPTQQTPPELRESLEGTRDTFGAISTPVPIAMLAAERVAATPTLERNDAPAPTLAVTDSPDGD